MGDELGPDGMHDLWRNQPLEPVGISVDDLRRKAHLLEAKMRRGFRVMAVLMILSAAGYAWFLYFFPRTVHRIGASLTLAGYLYCAYQLYKRGSLGKAPPDAASATGATYRAELGRQRGFCLDAWRTFLLPFVPGPAVFIMGFLVPEQGVVKAVVLTAALILSPFVLAVPMLRRKARTLQREIDELDSLMRQS
jgi:hypothetical protein